MEKERIQEFFNRLTELEDERVQWESHWSEINEYIIPNQGFFQRLGMQPNQGEKRNSKIIDGTATRAMRIFAAGMQGGLTSPSRPWFRLTLPDAELAEYGKVREWLDYVERAKYRIFSKSNFYSTVLSLYTDVGSFGTSAVYEEENQKRLVWFRNCTVGEYSIAEGPDGLVDTLYRRYWQTLRNVAAQFGVDQLTDSRRQQLKSSPDTWVECLHAVQPRDIVDPDKRDNKNMPFESVYLEMNNSEKVLWEGGYMEFPFMVPRWSTSGPDVWGRSPGMDILSDVKMLQEMQKTSIKALHKQVDPPLRFPGKYKDVVTTIPGGVNYLDVASQGEAGPLYQVDPDMNGIEAKIANIQIAIREGLFNQLFLAIINSGQAQMTAREVAERHEEKLLMLGPFIERHATEFHDPVINRTFNIMVRNGLLPPPPPEIMGQDLKVEYISVLAQAQKMVGTQAIRTTADFVAALAALKPEVLDKFDADEAVDQFGEMVGAPAKIIVADDKVAGIREQRAKQVAEQQQMAQAMAQVESAKTLGETNTQEGNALGDILKAAGA